MFRLWQLAYDFLRTAYRPEQQRIKVRSSIQLEAEAERGRAETSKVRSHVNKGGSRYMAKLNGEVMEPRREGGKENITWFITERKCA